MAEKKERKLTPVGIAKWAHVQTPKAPFEGKGDPKYMIDVVFDPKDEVAAEWLRDIRAKVEALPVQIDKKTGDPLRKQSPLKRDLDEQDQPTGKIVVTFKTGAKFKPGLFNRHGTVIPPEVLIGNGSKVRVNYGENAYDGFGGGINLYLNAVQVLELVEYGVKSAESFGFEVEPQDNPEDLPPF